MPHIKVNIAKIRNYSSEIASFSAGIRWIRDEFDCCAGRLDLDVKSSSNIDRRINNIVRELEIELASCEKMQSYLNAAAEMYAEMEGGCDTAAGFWGDNANAVPAVETILP